MDYFNMFPIPAAFDAGALENMEDQEFFNRLPETDQQKLLRGCQNSDQFHQRVHEARLCQ